MGNMTTDTKSHWFYASTNFQGQFCIHTMALGDHPANTHKFDDMDEALHMVKCFIESGEYDFSCYQGDLNQKFNKEVEKIIKA